MDDLIFDDDGNPIKGERYNPFKFYKEQLESFSSEERGKFDFIYILAMVSSSIRMDELLNKYNLRRNFAEPKYGNYKKFDEDELFKAVEELTRLNFKCDWEELDLELTKILLEYKRTKKIHYWIFGRTNELKIHFLEVISYSGLVEEYMKLNIDFKNMDPMNYDLKNLKYFDKVIELFARLKWLVFLKGKIEAGEYNTKAEISKVLPPLPECFLDQKYFDSILNNPKVSELYNKYDDGTYHLKKGKKARLAGLAHRLWNTGKLNKMILRTHQDLARVFCPFFHVQFNDKEEKQFQAERAQQECFDFIK